MRIMLLCAAILCLSACAIAQGNTTGTTSSDTPTAVEQPEATQIPTIVESFTVKLNDSSELTVEVVTFNDADNPHLRYIQGGKAHTQPITEISWLRYASGQAADLDGDGCHELVFMLWTGGSGGMGSNALCVLRWNGEGFVPLTPTPQNPENLEPDRLGYGFNAEITLMDDYQAHLYCPDTNLTHSFTVNQVYSDQSLYDADGKLTINASAIVTGIDAIAYLQVRPIENIQSITIAQMLWANMHAAIACLVTEFTYQDGVLMLINQFVDSNIEAYN